MVVPAVSGLILVTDAEVNDSQTHETVRLESLGRSAKMRFNIPEAESAPGSSMHAGGAHV
jgi:hypothetical protein